MSGPAAVASVTACHVLSRIVIYCHKIITAHQHSHLSLSLPRRIFEAPGILLSLSSPSRIHLSRLRAARHEPLRPQQLISHPDSPRVIRVSPGRKHDQTSPGSSEYNASPLIKTILIQKARVSELRSKICLNIQ